MQHYYVMFRHHHMHQHHNIFTTWLHLHVSPDITSSPYLLLQLLHLFMQRYHCMYHNDMTSSHRILLYHSCMFERSSQHLCLCKHYHYYITAYMTLTCINTITLSSSLHASCHCIYHKHLMEISSLYVSSLSPSPWILSPHI